ncbi:MAG: 6,7-dimethyl-8-ribityllumazine synthase [Verrucomicrobiae bacterium]|nr:6,7-dimethyl-8-ribityllumazine synthase [Verrucomicrobiae bacterium]
MLRAQKTLPAASARNLRFGIAAASYNTELADALLEHCVKTLNAAGAKTIYVVRVPGSFEISAAATWLAKSGRYDCVIGLGVILKGETSHAHHIADAVAHGLTTIACQTGVPTVFGVVTANTPKQARVRCLGTKYNRGVEAAETAIAMAHLHRAWKRT